MSADFSKDKIKSKFYQNILLWKIKIKKKSDNLQQELLQILSMNEIDCCFFLLENSFVIWHDHLWLGTRRYISTYVRMCPVDPVKIPTSNVRKRANMFLSFCSTQKKNSMYSKLRNKQRSTLITETWNRKKSFFWEFFCVKPVLLKRQDKKIDCHLTKKMWLGKTYFQGSKIDFHLDKYITFTYLYPLLI